LSDRNSLVERLRTVAGMVGQVRFEPDPKDASRMLVHEHWVDAKLLLEAAAALEALAKEKSWGMGQSLALTQAEEKVERLLDDVWRLKWDRDAWKTRADIMAKQKQEAERERDEALLEVSDWKDHLATTSEQLDKAEADSRVYREHQGSVSTGWPNAPARDDEG
jgi:hypothetical protein